MDVIEYFNARVLKSFSFSLNFFQEIENSFRNSLEIHQIQQQVVK